MVNENLVNLTNNKKPIELVQELKDYEVKKSSLSPAARKKAINKSGSNYVSEDREGYGPMYRASSNYSTSFSIKYKFDQTGNNRKNYFKQFGSYSSEWSASGSWNDLYKEQWKFEDKEIRIVKINSQGDYEINTEMEEKVKKQLREDVREFNLWEPGKSRNKERKFEDIYYVCQITETRELIYRCPTQTLQRGYSKK